ncbi:hypothetical protein F5X98DRAFT_332665 [Xylaria grammica]|nr:hypothetical protein F5X98DRAFT_332665 [Xylaria grammica]
MPSIFPKLQEFGPCLGSASHLFLCDRLPIDHRRLGPVELPRAISELHQRNLSPTGQFGFHVPPYDCKFPSQVGLDSSWVSFYTKLLRGTCELGVQINKS